MCVQVVVHLTEDLLSRASMTVVNGRPTLTINVSTAREQWLEGMLRHEIGMCMRTCVCESTLKIHNMSNTCVFCVLAVYN